MGFIDGLFTDKAFIVESLLSFIDDERIRIAGANLIKQEDCDRYLNNFIRKMASSSENMNTDQIICTLTKLYESMKNVKLAGDRFFEEEIKAEEIKPQEEIKPETPKINDIILDFVLGKLDDIVYKLGSTGKHIMASEVEKTIKNIKKIGE